MNFKYAPYSASKIKKFYECPLLFKYKYIDKLKVPFVEKIAFEKGKFFHYVLENYPKIPEKDFNFKLSSISDIDDYGELLKDLLKEPQLKELLVNDDIIEKEFWFKIMDTEGRIKLFQGQIDYLRIGSDKITIVDWKTGKQWGTDGSLEDPQVLIYAVWAFQEYPEINTVEASYYYLEQNKVVGYTFERSEHLDKIKSFLFKKINKIEDEDEFERTQHRFCHYCDYFEICEKENKT